MHWVIAPERVALVCRNFIMIFFLSLFPLHASSKTCISGIVTVKMLGGRTDSPIVKVQINGRKFGMYLSGDFDSIYISDKIDTLNLDLGFPLAQLTLITNGNDYDSGNLVQIDEFKIEDFKIGTVNAIVTDGIPIDYVENIPIIGVIGSILFKSIDVYIDYPKNLISLISVSNKNTCEFGTTDLFNKPYHQTEMGIDGKSELTMKTQIDGIIRYLHLDISASTLTIPHRWLEEGKTKEKSFNETISYGENIKIGYDSKIKLFCVGDFCKKDAYCYINKGISYGFIGNDFFNSREVLFDYKNQQILFSDTQPDDRRIGDDLHALKMRTAHATVNRK